MLRKTKIVPYDVNLYVHIGIPSEKIQKKFDIHITLDNIAEVHEVDNSIFVWFESKVFEAPIVAHEVIHIKNIVYQLINAKHDFNNDEFEAYLVEDIVNKIEKIYNQLK